MLYKNLKIFLRKIPVIWSMLTWSKDLLIIIFRLKDVFMMMVLFNVWPEQTYRFSTRKLLPHKKNRYFKKTKPDLPFALLKSKTSEIPIIKEINLIGKGSSFDLNNIKNLKGPIFLISVRLPLKIDNNGLIIFVYHARDMRSTNEGVKNIKNLKDLKNNDFTYVLPSNEHEYIGYLIEGGQNIITVELHTRDKNGNIYSLHHNTLSKPSSPHPTFSKHDLIKHISLEEKVYITPLLPPYANWTAAGSFLPAVYALLNFAEKINIYGWDFYLESSPEDMSYWQLFFNMYKYKADKRSKNHFESTLINFYFAYQLSKLPNVNIYGYLGRLGKHEKLIKKIERVLFK